MSPLALVSPLTIIRPTVAGLVLALGAAVAIAADSVPQEEVRDGSSAAESVATERELSAWLEGQKPSRAPQAPIRIAIAPEERAGLGRSEAGAGGVPLKIGLVRTLSPGLVVAGFDRVRIAKRGHALAGGTVAATGDGGFVWTTSVESAGAARLRIHLSDIDLPPNAALYVFGNGEGFGPFEGQGPNGDGDFWTPSVPGPDAQLLVRHTGPASPSEKHRLRFVVSAVGHIESAPQPVEEAGTSFCGNPTCIVDASCLSSSAVTNAKNAVAQLEWVSGPYLYTCTGGLLADTVTSSQIPYLLTANHCLSRQRDATSLEAFFFYRTGTCGGTCPSNSGFPRTVGATIKATGTAGDFTLLQLSQTPPTGTLMLGWNRTAVAFSNGIDLYRISHPNFGPQTYSHHRVDTSAPTCGNWPRGQRIYSRDVEGATDGGSSGSPVVNAAGQVVGQLSGGCGFNVNDVCDASSNATVDGALAYYFAQVAPYLDPASGGGCTPTTEECTDGVDNDCDGAIDCADGNCAGNSACTSCTAVGGSCTLNAQCCSGICKGKSGHKTCK